MPHLTAVLVIGTVSDVVIPVLDAPLVPRYTKQLLGILRDVREGWDAGNGVDRFARVLALLHMETLPFDAHDLGGRTEAHLFRFYRQAPDLTDFHPSVLFLRGLRLRFCPRGGKRLSTGARPWPQSRVGSL